MMNTEQKRLFIGFPLEIGSSLSAALKRTKINAQRREMEFNWTPTPNFHVTMNFLGETAIADIPRLISLIETVASEHAPLITSLRGMGAFPDERHMRVLWIGVHKSRSLSSLHEHMREALVANGFTQEERAYVPHLTIGRLRKSRAGGDLLSPYVRTSFGDVDVKSVVLFESIMHGARPAYPILHRCDLSGEAPEASLEIES
jgi:2'-5' RNA ligase